MQNFAQSIRNVNAKRFVACVNRSNAIRSISTTSNEGSIWSGTYSFASPEADFTSMNLTMDPSYSGQQSEYEWSQSLSFASAESDFTSIYGNGINVEGQASIKREAFLNYVKDHENVQNDMAYSMAHTTDNTESDPRFNDLLDARMASQLENVTSSHIVPETKSLSDHANPRELSPIPDLHDADVSFGRETEADDFFSHPPIFHEEPLPHNLAEASIADDPRAIVITEATMPFRIVSVNDSWEKLCGYSQNECRGHTLEMIQGPETNRSAITALMAQLLKGEEAGTVLTNYSKNGRKFHNRLRVGPLKNDQGLVTHFVGVLKEVNERGEHFHENLAHA